MLRRANLRDLVVSWVLVQEKRKSLLAWAKGDECFFGLNNWMEGDNSQNWADQRRSDLASGDALSFSPLERHTRTVSTSKRVAIQKRPGLQLQEGKPHLQMTATHVT